MNRIGTFLAALMLCGCAQFVSQVQSEIQSQKATHELLFLADNSKPILACVKRPGGKCDLSVQGDDPRTLARSPGLRAKVLADAMASGVADRRSDARQSADESIGRAALALTSPAAIKLERLFHHASGASENEKADIALSRQEMVEYAKFIQEGTSLQSWTPLRERVATYAKGINDRAEHAAAEAVVRQLTLVEAYLSAYFSNGEFVSLTIDSRAVEASAVKELMEKLRVSEATAKQLVSKLVGHLIEQTPGSDGKYHVLTKLKDGGFVTRGGAKYSFPGVSISIDPKADKPLQISSIDFTQVGADVVRVFLEASLDEWGQLPTDSTSTACKALKAGRLEKYDYLRCYIEASEQVKASQFGQVNDIANKAETYSAAVTGQVIRGISWISLNNEAIAKLIETAVGVTARKAAEKASWCYFACKAESTKQDARNPVEFSAPGIRRVSVSVGQ